MTKTIPFISNVPKIESDLHYSAIIGLTPSSGARSPVLWNNAYKYFSVNVRMHPFDVRDLEALGLLMAFLKSDRYFLGGAVAAPYKTAIIPFLDALEEEAAAIGAVNCIYRKGSSLIGCNTDGAGAIKVLEDRVVALSDTSVLLFGLGGAGLAVGVYLARQVGKLTVVNRDHSKSIDFAARFENVKALQPTQLTMENQDVDIIVNATSCGFAFEGNTAARLTALSSSRDIATNLAETKSFMSSLPRLSLLFDIVYQPEITPLMHCGRELGITTINGLEMNLLQAVIAYAKTNCSDVGFDRIKSAMTSGTE